jgi:hypothetical protein
MTFRIDYLHHSDNIEPLVKFPCTLPVIQYTTSMRTFDDIPIEGTVVASAPLQNSLLLYIFFFLEMPCRGNT